MGKHTVWALLGIIIIGAIFRLLNLTTTPPGLWPDEAVNGLNALEALSQGDFKVFYTDNFGREGLFINLQAFSISIFGATSWALRFVAAVIGIFTVGALFFVGRELFTKTYHPHMTALVASLLGAVSFWHVNFSRIGFRAILLPLFASLAVWWMISAMRNRSQIAFAASGFMYGISLSTYISARFLPILALVCFVYDLWREHKNKNGAQWKSFVIVWGWCFIGFFVAALPLLGYFAYHPADFFGRANDVAVFAAADPIAEFTRSLTKTLGMFHVAGDNNFRHNLGGSPQLDLLSGILFLTGIAVALSLLLRLRNAKGRRFYMVVLFVWFGLMLLPGILSQEGVPHALRTLGAIPPVMLIAALGFGWLAERTTKMLGRQWSHIALMGLLTIVSVINFYQYFFVWASHPETQKAFRYDLTVMAKVLREQHIYTQKVVVINQPGATVENSFIELAPIRFLDYADSTIIYKESTRLAEIIPQFEKTMLVPLQANDQELEASLRALFPTVKRKETQGIEYFSL